MRQRLCFDFAQHERGSVKADQAAPLLGLLQTKGKTPRYSSVRINTASPIRKNSRNGAQAARKGG